MSTSDEQKLPSLFDQIESKPSTEGEGNQSKPKKEMSIRDKLRKKKQEEKNKDAPIKEEENKYVIKSVIFGKETKQE